MLTVDSFKKELDDSEFEVVKILPTQFYYGIILTGDARNLSNNFKEYLVMYPIEFILQDKKVRIERSKNQKCFSYLIVDTLNTGSCKEICTRFGKKATYISITVCSYIPCDSSAIYKSTS